MKKQFLSRVILLGVLAGLIQGISAAPTQAQTSSNSDSDSITKWPLSEFKVKGISVHHHKNGPVFSGTWVSPDDDETPAPAPLLPDLPAPVPAPPAPKPKPKPSDPSDLLDDVLHTISDFFGNVKKSVQEAVDKLAGLVGRLVPGLLDGGDEDLEKLFGEILGVDRKELNAVVNETEDYANAIIEAEKESPGLLSSFQTSRSDPFHAIISDINSLSGILQEAALEAREINAGNVDEVIGDVREKVDRVTKRIAVFAVLLKFVGLGNGVKLGVEESWAVAGALENFADSLTNLIFTLLSGERLILIQRSELKKELVESIEALSSQIGKLGPKALELLSGDEVVGVLKDALGRVEEVVGRFVEEVGRDGSGEEVVDEKEMGRGL